MLRVKTFEMIAWSFALFTMPCIASEQTLNVTSNLVDESTIEQKVEKHGLSGFSGYRERDNRHSKIKSLKLADFAGAWVIGADSVGGVSGAGTTGTSLTIDGQISFDEFGNGTAHFLAGASYAGTPGDVTFFRILAGTTITLSLTDPIHGVGTVSIVNPSFGINETVNFVAIRSKKDGSPLILKGHPISVGSTISHVLSYTLERQFQ